MPFSQNSQGHVTMHISASVLRISGRRSTAGQHRLCESLDCRTRHAEELWRARIRRLTIISGHADDRQASDRQIRPPILIGLQHRFSADLEEEVRGSP